MRNHLKYITAKEFQLGKPNEDKRSNKPVHNNNNSYSEKLKQIVEYLVVENQYSVY